jgi:hypothetical protein
MPGKVKRCGYVSYGYCGWHETWEGRKVFLRSTLEFIYARSLDIDRVSYRTEEISYIIGNKTYKPDFFLYEKEKLTKIVEIKGNKPEALKAKERYSPFFLVLGVDYEVMWAFWKMISKYHLEDDIIRWKEKSIKDYNKISYAGENNPRFGQHCSEETKALIGFKAKERFKDPEYRKKASNSQKKRAEDLQFLYDLYKQRSINFMKKIQKGFNISREEFFSNIDFYSKKARQEGIIPPNSGLSSNTLQKYKIIVEDI